MNDEGRRVLRQALASMFSVFRGLFRPRSSEESFIVVVARVPDGVSAEAGFELCDLFNRSQADGWWFLNPGTFEAFFASGRRGAARAVECRGALERVRPHHPCLADLKVGHAMGRLVVSRTANGELSLIPLGGAVDQALRHAG